ncbi:hypothetical protein C1H46_041208 [Malus baccata]|uniref:Uncharacterized protein n=1 Tax=Malus baccata TaxID=106549 RepID=A0A540KGB6_MALBA|nr:hypothetical protein C1H46_041208 [Malus baccata]
MQGQMGTIGSLPEMLDFDHGSASNDAALDQQICWNSTRNLAERIPDWAGILVSADGRSLSTVAADGDFLVLTREWIESTRAWSWLRIKSPSSSNPP